MLYIYFNCLIIVLSCWFFCRLVTKLHSLVELWAKTFPILHSDVWAWVGNCSWFNSKGKIKWWSFNCPVKTSIVGKHHWGHVEFPIQGVHVYFCFQIFCNCFIANFCLGIWQRISSCDKNKKRQKTLNNLHHTSTPMQWTQPKGPNGFVWPLENNLVRKNIHFVCDRCILPIRWIGGHTRKVKCQQNFWVAM